MMTKLNELDELYRQIAVAALADGIEPYEPETEDESLADWSRRNYNGPLAQWVRRNVRYRPDTEFLIIWGVALAMGEIAKAELPSDAAETRREQIRPRAPVKYSASRR